jgi:hypothetical protein
MLAAGAGVLVLVGMDVGNPCAGALRLPTAKPATAANTPNLWQRSRGHSRSANRDISLASPIGR